MWQQLGLETILRRVGLSAWARLLSKVMTLNRLICPLSEHATPDWLRRTAVGDILGTEFATLTEDALYRNLDKLHPHREQIERELAAREQQLFHLDETIYLYDLTSTYFEGQVMRNRQAKRGYSRDKRPDCKQVLVGLVLDRDGFPKAHEIFEGNRQDRSTVPDMLERLKKRTGTTAGATVVVDRGMAYEENLAQIRAQGLHYIVAGRQAERDAWLTELEADDWEDVERTPSPRNPHQHKSRVQIKRRQQSHEVYVLCLSEGREAKDRAIRQMHEQRLLADLEALRRRIEKGQLKGYGEDPPRDWAPPGAPSASCAVLPDRIRRSPEASHMARGHGEESHRRAARWQLRAEDRSARVVGGGDLAHLCPADACGSRLSGHEKPVDGAPDLPPPPATHGDAHFPLHLSLPPARGHREKVLGPRHAHVLVEPPPTAQHPSDRHSGAPNRQRADREDSEGHHTRADASRNLCNVRHPHGSHEAQDLAREHHLVTKRHWKPACTKDCAQQSAEVRLNAMRRPA
jgi:hypothetical protein